MERNWETVINGKHKAFWSNGTHSKFKVVNGKDSFDLDDSDASGVYIWVTMNFGPWQCREMLYALKRDNPVFWICERTWDGPPTRGKKFRRDSVYPVGSKVRLNHVPAVNSAAGADNKVLSNSDES